MSSNLVFRKLSFKIISGNIGIGTNNPQTILHLYSSNNSKILLENAINEESEITFKNSDNLWKIGLNCNLNIGSYYNEPISAITITSNLNIGIGVSYPREKLEIAGHIIPAACNLYDLGNSNLRFRDIYLSGNTIDLGGTKISRELESGALNVLTSTGLPTDINAKAIYVSESFHIVSNLYTITKEGNIGIGTTNPQAYLHIIEHSNIHPLRIDDPKTNTTPLIIKHDGNVGIGTTNPIAKLHVEGNILINNQLIFNNATRLPRFEHQNFILELNGSIFTPINRTKVTYNFTGADQTFTVPAGVSFIFAKLWGAGGGNGRAGGWNWGADGGGGGHSYALIPVTPGENLTIRVGAGGRTTINTSSFGGGGGGQTNTDYAGQGGGGVYIFRGSTPLLIAGGGGGGGASRTFQGNIGGAGGGLVGQKGESPYDNRETYGGTGGTQSAGGTSAQGGVATGSLYQGGQSGASSYGGGGGGGYYGGGGGSYIESNTMGGGGGGSGFVATSCIFGGTFTGNFRTPAFYWDNDLPPISSNRTLISYGMQNVQNNIGVNVQTAGNGICIIYY